MTAIYQAPSVLLIGDDASRIDWDETDQSWSKKDVKAYLHNLNLQGYLQCKLPYWETSE